MVVLIVALVGVLAYLFSGAGSDDGDSDGPSGGSDVNFTMPSVVGLDLQDAQDLMQQNGVYYSVSHDLLGTRQQVLDSNWQVCTQTPAAGTLVTGDVEGRIDFGVVKREEFCP